MSTGVDLIEWLTDLDVPGPDDVETLDLRKQEEYEYLSALDGDDVDGRSRLLSTLALRTRERWTYRDLGLLMCLPGLWRWYKRAKRALEKGSEEARVNKKARLT